MKTKQPRLLNAPAECDDAHGVCFQCVRPQAKTVYLAGSFNQWQPTATAMNRNGGGKWEARIALPPGRYEYRYIADGEWISDASAENVPNPFGSTNSVLVVVAAAAAPEPQTAKSV